MDEAQTEVETQLETQHPETKQPRDAYAVDRIAAHPKALADLRHGGSHLITVHLMPCNACNHSCSWCAYRLHGSQCSETFDERSQIPLDKLIDLLDDLEEMGVQGIEVTGGGEPTIYRHFDRLWEELARRPFASALVTNGTTMASKVDVVAAARPKWARVSIDAARPETYSRARSCPESHFVLAWRAVELLRKHAPNDPEFRLGAAFTLSNENVDEVFEFCRLAWEHGADNVRLSATMSSLGTGYFNDMDAVRRAADAGDEAAARFNCRAFAVHNNIPMRLREMERPWQDYKRCVTKDVLCVVEGECKVYSCCTFTGSKKGCYGKFSEHPKGFKGLWKDGEAWRRALDAREYCRLPCLYHDRNNAALRLVESRDSPPDRTWVHKEFV